MKKLILLSAITFWFNLAMGQDSNSAVDTQYLRGYTAPIWNKPSYLNYGNRGDSLVVIDSLQSILVGIAREKMVYEWLVECREELRKSYMAYNKLIGVLNDHLTQDREMIKSLRLINTKK